MTITLNDPDGMLNDDLRSQAERRLRFSLSRFDSRITRVELAVSKIAHAAGNVESACRVTVKLKRADTVEVRDHGSCLEKTIARVADRSGRSVSRSLDRARQMARRGISDSSGKSNLSDGSRADSGPESAIRSTTRRTKTI